MLLGTVLVLLLLGGAGPAAAHAGLRSTDPEDGAVLPDAPGSVTVTFTESVGLRDDSFRVLGPDGHRLSIGEAGRADGRPDTAGVTLPDRLAEGTYTVAWRVVSADSHPASGAFTFSVGEPSVSAAEVDTGPAEDPVTGALHKSARWFAYLAVALLIGTAAFVVLCRPRDPAPLRRLAVAGWWTLLAATVALLVLRAPYEAGEGPAAALDAEAFGRTLTGRPGMLLLARLVLLVPAGLLLARVSRRPRRTPWVTGAGAALSVALALTWAAAEHASAGSQVPLAMTSAVLHLLATAVWLGGLAALLVGLRRAPDADAVARFSRIAFASVVVLVVTGAYQSWRGLGTWTALNGTTYGKLLLAKVAAVTVLLAVAALSRQWTAALGAVTEPGAPDAPPPLRRGPSVPAAAVSVSDVRTVSASATAAVSGARTVPKAAASGVEAVSASAAGVRTVSAKVTSPSPSPSRAPEPPPTAPVPPEPAVPALTTRTLPAPATPAVEPPDTPAVEPPAPSPVKPPAVKPPAPPTPPWEAHRRALRRSVLIEAVVAAVVLVITTVLTATMPGTAAEAARSARAGVLPASVTTIPFEAGPGRGTVQITLDPGRTGENSVQAVVYAPDGSLTAVPELRVTFTLADQGIGPIEARLVDRGGYWSANSVTLPLAGAWTMKATVRLTEVDQVSEERTVDILA
ncbi:copper resistance CopC/CopD family protein [Streptomyces tagetis]|uniref:Copper resistance protein CopC/CopD n=1 Tax=Streptomyces tagetis TaxID=2820809 RepID=A0A941B1C7_9ACTN|nr:copper resistance protein CopC [Streptomyces sp. RG38]MBQ0827876.1 copper resistance protein CopC/CopD [Streptomyces sp. RG38]